MDSKVVSHTYTGTDKQFHSSAQKKQVISLLFAAFKKLLINHRHCTSGCWVLSCQSKAALTPAPENKQTNTLSSVDGNLSFCVYSETRRQKIKIPLSENIILVKYWYISISEILHLRFNFTWGSYKMYKNWISTLVVIINLYVAWLLRWYSALILISKKHGQIFNAKKKEKDRPDDVWMNAQQSFPIIVAITEEWGNFADRIRLTCNILTLNLWLRHLGWKSIAYFLWKVICKLSFVQFM